MVFGFISNLIFGDQGNKNDQELILILCYFGFKGIVKKVFEFFSNHVLVHIMSIYMVHIWSQWDENRIQLDKAYNFPVEFRKAVWRNRFSRY